MGREDGERVGVREGRSERGRKKEKEEERRDIDNMNTVYVFWY